MRNVDCLSCSAGSLRLIHVYKRERHNLIASVLVMLDADLLRDHHCYFSGGTAIAMRYGEYRTSFDVDFMVEDAEGFREIRALAKAGGLHALVRPEFRSALGATDARVDQYGIRGFFLYAGKELKFEIVREGRIVFDTPGSQDRVAGVTSLTETDLVAEKLLANSDRWADSAVFNRDAIDLAIMGVSDLGQHPGFVKARDAYGSSMQSDLQSAVMKLIESPRWLERCHDVLEIDVPQAVLVKKLKRLLGGA